MRTVAVFTDTYLPTVNGVTYTVATWRERWRRRGGRMPVVYPDDAGHLPRTEEYPVASVPFPFYQGFRFGWPSIPEPIRSIDPDVVHAHTPFTLGLAGLRFARNRDVPLVASYHTPAEEYASYISDAFAGIVGRAADRYERQYFREADAVVVPTETVRNRIETGETPVYVVSNGVDTERFAPPDDGSIETFRERHDLSSGPLIGYTGRHGREKRLADLLAASVGLDVTVAIAGNGPTRPDLRRRAAARENVRFLGFLDRRELPAFYAALDVLAFPSPIETQGIVALEAIACGTPVVAVDDGALSETVTDGETGYHYRPNDIDGFREAIRRTLAERDRLSERCLARRDALSVDRSIADLRAVYGRLNSASRTPGR